MCRRIHILCLKARVVPLLAYTAFALFPLYGQGPAGLAGAGYAAPKPLDVAPGQIITLFVRIPNKAPADPVSASAPLPLTLGGFSGVLRQMFPSGPVAVPILSVADGSSCSSLPPAQCDMFSMVTVQIPFELTPNIPRGLLPANFARLEISYSSALAATVFLNPVTDQIHALRSCDAMVNRPGSCLPYVTHADGTAVGSANPAHSGETLTVTMVGLGLAAVPVATGVATPDSSATVDGVHIGFDFRPNASPSVPVDAAFALQSARLRPGSVGIYEVAFTVPEPPPGIEPCAGAVFSNVLVNIGRGASFEGVGICVDTPATANRAPLRSRM